MVGDHVDAPGIHDQRQALRYLIGQVHGFLDQQVLAMLGGAVAAKRFHLRLLFGLVKALAGSRLANVLMLAGVILIHPGFRTIAGEPRGFAFGLSANNVRALERLRGGLGGPERQELHLNGRSASIVDRLTVCISLRALWSAAGDLAAAAHANAFIHVQSVIACALFIAYRMRPLPSSARVLCVANDHAPASLAILAAARLQGLRTCYIQHAPVTKYFPPLSFDLAILYDQSSARAYEEAALARGVAAKSPVLLLSPFEDSFRRPGPVPAPMRIGVCLSLLPNRPRLEELLQAISRHPNVATVVLRPHPRCRSTHSSLLDIDKVVMQEPGTSAAAYFQAVDVVLAPNSGVTIEALHSGRPTFFTPRVDEVEVDYYGFVEAGVVPVFATSDLDHPERMHAFFDDAWVDRYSAFDETVHSAPEEARKRIAPAFATLVAKPL